MLCHDGHAGHDDHTGRDHHDHHDHCHDHHDHCHDHVVVMMFMISVSDWITYTNHLLPTSLCALHQHRPPFIHHSLIIQNLDSMSWFRLKKHSVVAENLVFSRQYKRRN